MENGYQKVVKIFLGKDTKHKIMAGIGKYKGSGKFTMSMKAYGEGKSPLHKDMPPHIKRQTKTNYKESKSKSSPNEKTNHNYDMHDVHAEQENPTDGRYCKVCGGARETHDATHSFKINRNK